MNKEGTRWRIDLTTHAGRAGLSFKYQFNLDVIAIWPLKGISMKHTFGKRPVSRVLFGLLAGALVVSACGSGSSPASEDTTSDTVSSDTSAPRERNAMVGGFGTDGSGFIDIPLAGLTSRIRSNLTLHRNGDGSSNVAFHESGTIEGEPINTLVQARLLSNGTFDTTFGEGGFVKFELKDYSVNKILFDSQGNLLLWMQTYVEIPNSGASPEENNWKEVNEIRAFTFGGSTPNANYGDAGVIALEAVAPEGISEIVVGRRGTAADALMLIRFANDTREIVSITSRGQIDTSVTDSGVNGILDATASDNWDARLVDTSLLSRSDNMYEVAVAGPSRGPRPTDCPKYDSCQGAVISLDYSLSTAKSAPILGTTNEVDDLLDMGEGEIHNIFLASYGVSYGNDNVSAQSTEMNEKPELPELIVTTRNYESSSAARGVFNTETSQWTAVTHFSFFDTSEDGSDIYYDQPVVAPTGPALIAFYDDYEQDNVGLIACNSILGMCDVADASRIVYAQNTSSWPNLTDVRVDQKGQIHALVTGLSIAKTKTDALIDLASDGSPSSVQTEQMPASLRTEAAVNGNTWTPEVGPILGANNTIYIPGNMVEEISGRLRTVPAIGTITKTQSGRSVLQERFMSPRGTGLSINWNSNLKFDGAGNDYVPAWKNSIYGFVRLLPGTKALDTSYGVGGFAQVDEAPTDDSVCTWTDYEVADSGQVIVMRSVGERRDDDDCDWDGRKIADVVALTANGALDPAIKTRGAFASLEISPSDGVVLSPTTKEMYVVNSAWIEDEVEGEIQEVSILRYSVAGVLDTTFGTDGVLTYKGYVPLNSVSPVEADKEGRLIFAAIDSSSEDINVRIARLNRDGTLDAAVDVPEPAPPTPSDQRKMREEQQQVAAIPVPQPVQQPASVLISGTKAIGDGSVEVSWISNAVTTNATFTVTASPGGKTCTSTTTSCVVKGLDAWQKYTFTVAQAGEALQSGASVETQPVRMVKVGSSVAVKKLLAPGSKGAAKYAVSGGCKLSKSTTLVAPKKAGTCLLSVKTAKVGKTAATMRSVRIQIVTALPK